MRTLPFLPSMFEPPRLNRTVLTNSALAAVVTIPLVFALLDVWANWNPTHHLDQVKAAVVNLDAPVTVTGTDGRSMQVALGKTLSDQLTGSEAEENFDWKETDAASAQSGLKDGDYQAVITIPQDFSAAATSAVRKDAADAKQAVLRVRTNDAQNYIVGTIAGAISSATTAALNAQVNKTYLDNIYVGFTSLHDQITEAAVGAGELTDGARRLALGNARANAVTGELVVGLGQLNSGGRRVSSGNRDLAQGAGRIDNGMGELSSGLNRLESGTRSLPAKTAELNAGAHKIAAGNAKVAAGTRKLNAGAGELAAGASRLAAGASELAAGTPALESGAQTLAAQAVPLASTIQSLSAICPAVAPGAPPEFCGGLAALAAGAPGLVSGTADLAAGAVKVNTGAQELKTGSRELKAGTSELKAGAAELAAGTPELAVGSRKLARGTAKLAGAAPELSSGIASAADGARRLNAGTSELASGSAQLATGASALSVGIAAAHDGAARISDGTAQLASGSRQLRAGSAELSEGLTAGAKKIPSYTDKERQVLSAVGAAPVVSDVKRVNAVEAYGAGVAPYFMAFGLWVGAIAIYLLLRVLSEHSLISSDPSWRIAASGLVPGIVTAIVQAVLLVIGLQIMVGLGAASVFGLALFAILVGLTFTAINHALVTLFGGTGRLLSLLWAGIQLASAGGTYPVETAPGIFGALHGLMPITYAVQGFRALIAGGGPGLGTAVIGLLIWTAIALAVAVFAAQRQRTWTVSHLQPPPEPAPAT